MTYMSKDYSSNTKTIPKIKSYEDRQITSLETVYINSTLKDLVVEFTKLKKNKIIGLCSHKSTPFIIFDKQELIKCLTSFMSSFTKYIPDIKPFYAMKMNQYKPIYQTAVEYEYGLDVASGRELRMALDVGCNNMVFFSPGKSVEDLTLAVNNADKVTINMDSFRELEKLGKITSKIGKQVRAGIRILTPSQEWWGGNKYGIVMKELVRFWKKASKYPNIKLCGIHFHTSRNKNPDNYVSAIKELATYLKCNFSNKMLSEIDYIDIGGGYDTNMSEGLYREIMKPELLSQLESKKMASPLTNQVPYYIQKTVSFDTYAQSIGSAIDSFLRPITKARYYTEPGRIICSNAMHAVIEIADIKNSNTVIVNAGVNNFMGWPRYDNYEYYPVINLTHSSDKEIPVKIFGNLCVPWDIWGKYCYASKLEEGDILVIPNQGALSYSIAQDWIYPKAKVYILK